MTLNPLNELKRRLEDTDIVFSKRLCLAKNIIISKQLPSEPKERIISMWLGDVANASVETEVIDGVLDMFENLDDVSSVLKSKSIQLISSYLESGTTEINKVEKIIKFTEKEIIVPQITTQTTEFLNINKQILLTLKKHKNFQKNLPIFTKVVENYSKFYKESKKKMDFVKKLLTGDNLEILFEFLKFPDLKETVNNVLQNILFPLSRKISYTTFLQHLLRTENIDSLLQDKNDNLQAAVKTLTVFLTFPNGRNIEDPIFIENFIEAFIFSYKSDSQLIFVFLIIFFKALGIKQSYYNPTSEIPMINLKDNAENIKRNIFLTSLSLLAEYEIDVNVQLTDMFGEKTEKVEIKKNLILFLQNAMMSILKLDGEIDQVTLKIIQATLSLDPTIIEPKLDAILPTIMVSKKTPTNADAYIDMLNYLLEIIFKLNFGAIFVNRILPHIQIQLEALNASQFRIYENIHNCLDKDMKKLTCEDLFPEECITKYGKLTAQLTFKQNYELFLILQKDFDENCILMLSEGFVSPSLIILTNLFSNLLATVLENCKMSDHKVPVQISRDFEAKFQDFETELMSKFGKCILKLNYKSDLFAPFLNLCLSIANFKLLKCQYGLIENDILLSGNTDDVYDFNLVLPCLSNENWNKISEQVEGNSDLEAKKLLNKILLNKMSYIELLKIKNMEISYETEPLKNLFIQEINDNIQTLKETPYNNIIFKNLSEKQLKQLSKKIVKNCIENNENMFLVENQENDKDMLNFLALEVAKNIAKVLENEEIAEKSLSKNLAKTNFDITAFSNGNENFADFFENISKTDLSSNFEEISNYTTFLKQLKLPFLRENTQLIVLLLLLAVKKHILKSKKSIEKTLRKEIDILMLEIFELSPKNPDVFKIFAVEYIFNFMENSFLHLVTLKNKNDKYIIVKAILQTAVKNVKNDSDVIKNTVNVLLSNLKYDTNFFDSDVFQIMCLILPLIAKEKRAITTSAYRSILSELQEKLQRALQKSFINLEKTISETDDGNKIGEKITENGENNLKTDFSTVLNAIEAFSLILTMKCESQNQEKLENNEFIWKGLKFFTNTALQTIQNKESKKQHIISSINLINNILRHTKKLTNHEIFQSTFNLHTRIWESLKTRLEVIFTSKFDSLTDSQSESTVGLEEIVVTVKFLSEFCDLNFFNASFVGDLTSLMVLKAPSSIIKSKNIKISHEVAKNIWDFTLKANITGLKSVSLSKSLQRTCKNLSIWIKKNFDSCQNESTALSDDSDVVKTVKNKLIVDDSICEVLKLDLDIISEGILSAKKIPLNFKHMDAIFILLQQLQIFLSCQIESMCQVESSSQISWDGFLTIWDGCENVLNSLLLSRGELLEDRWPCFLNTYRSLIFTLCKKSSMKYELDKHIEDKLSEKAHTMEKLTQQVCARQNDISKLAVYVIADICNMTAEQGPAPRVRQHLNNVTSLLMRTCDSNYCMSFLKRVLSTNMGGAALSSVYMSYKAHHKYTGSS